jgi:hypothetical protein
MKRLSWLLLALLSAFPGFAQAPTDNPVASFYAETNDFPWWTQEIKWNNVITMTPQANGAANFAEFKLKRDELYAQGGGVLYYPAGTWEFDIPDGPGDEGLMLKKGVVIRGEKPGADLKAVTVKSKNAQATDHGLNSMPTKFKFTTTTSPAGNTLPGAIPKAWNMIGMKKGTNETSLSQISHVGVAWVEIEFGYMYFGMDNRSGWAPTWGSSNSWLGNKAVNGWQNRVPDGTHPMDPFHGTRYGLGNDTSAEGEKIFVFGVHLKNAAIPNYMSNKAGVDNFICDVESWRFTGKITVEGKHIFIANNVISKPTACFRMPYTCKGGGQIANGTVVQARFDYGYGTGIDVNKGLGSAFKNRAFINNTIEGIYFLEDVVIQDNVIYNHGNKSIEAAGKYLVIKGNVMPRDFLSHTDDPYNIGSPNVGINTSNGRCWTQESVDDMMSRTMDLGGWMTWVDDNYGKFTGTSYANDGEGILYQRHNGIETYGVAITNNSLLNGYLAPYDVHAVGVLHAWNDQPGSIGIVKQEANWIEDCAFPGQTNIPPTNPASPTGSAIQDYMMECGNPMSLQDTVLDLLVTWDAVHDGVKISYTDNSTNEIGFRIEKRKLGDTTWTIVAYRPRQQTSSGVTMDSLRRSFGYPTPLSLSFPSNVLVDELNPPVWYDFKGAPNQVYEYRIATLDCQDSDAAATGTTVSVKKSRSVLADPMDVFPNPAQNQVNIRSKAGLAIQSVEILNPEGKSIREIHQGLGLPEARISTEGLAPGAYFIEVHSGKGSSYRGKLMIK